MSIDNRTESPSQVKNEDMEMTPPESDDDPFIDEQDPFVPINWNAEVYLNVFFKCSENQINFSSFAVSC